MNDDIESERKADAGEYQGPDRVYAKTEVHLHCFHILHYQKKNCPVPSTQMTMITLYIMDI